MEELLSEVIVISGQYGFNPFSFPNKLALKQPAESFAPGIQVGALYRQDLDFYPFSFEHSVELCREFRVMIANPMGELFTLVLQVQ